MKICEITNSDLTYPNQILSVMYEIDVDFESQTESILSLIDLLLPLRTPSRNLRAQGNVQQFYDTMAEFDMIGWQRPDPIISKIRREMTKWRKIVDSKNRQLVLPPGHSHAQF